MTFAVLGTGPSMSQAVADSVRHLRVIAVNQAYEMAPWAEAIAAIDSRWWTQNPEAKKSPAVKYSWARIPCVERVETDIVQSSTCSGVLALEVAKMRGARRVLMLGFDFHGTHYFGPYQRPLQNTSEEYRRIHRHQFARWAKFNRDVEVINCTPGSKLDVFPMRSLDACLAESALHAA